MRHGLTRAPSPGRRGRDEITRRRPRPLARSASTSGRQRRRGRRAPARDRATSGSSPLLCGCGGARAGIAPAAPAALLPPTGVTRRPPLFQWAAAPCVRKAGRAASQARGLTRLGTRPLAGAVVGWGGGLAWQRGRPAPEWLVRPYAGAWRRGEALGRGPTARRPLRYRCCRSVGDTSFPPAAGRSAASGHCRPPDVARCAGASADGRPATAASHWAGTRAAAAAVCGGRDGVSLGRGRHGWGRRPPAGRHDRRGHARRVA